MFTTTETKEAESQLDPLLVLEAGFAEAFAALATRALAFDAMHEDEIMREAKVYLKRASALPGAASA